LGLRGFGDGPALKCKLNHPVACCVERSGRLIVCDSLGHRLRLFDPATGLVTTLVGVGSPGSADAAMGQGLSASFRLVRAAVLCICFALVVSMYFDCCGSLRPNFYIFAVVCAVVVTADGCGVE
jgi:hypothetical protein